MLHEFSYVAPQVLDELLEFISLHHSEATLLAGGTDLLVNIRNGTIKPRYVVDIKKIKELNIIKEDDQWLHIGATATVNELLGSPIILEGYPLLVQCAKDLASFQLRNRATVAGNIVNASPCSDMAPGLLCLESSVRLVSANGERIVPLNEFFIGVKKTALMPGELLSQILIPLSRRGTVGRYKKLKRINGHDLGIIGVAVALQGLGLSLAISSAAPTPVCTGMLVSTAVESEVLERIRAIVKPISDVRCTKEYRQFMVETYVKRLLKEVRS